MLHDDPVPTPGPGQIVVRMRATSLNYRDLLAAAGQLPGVRPGLVPLSDGAGEIVAVGAGVQRVKAGDRVVAAFNQSWIGGRPEAARKSVCEGQSVSVRVRLGGRPTLKKN